MGYCAAVVSAASTSAAQAQIGVIQQQAVVVVVVVTVQHVVVVVVTVAVAAVAGQMLLHGIAIVLAGEVLQVVLMLIEQSTECVFSDNIGHAILAGGQTG